MEGEQQTSAETGIVVEQPEDDEEEEEELDGDDGGDVADGGSGKRKRRKRKLGKRKIRGRLSNKPQDFQIRIRVLEARQLQGANIQPVSRVTVWNQTKQTRIKKSTNSPFWNEVFFFNFNTSPAELFDELIEFQVFNSRRLRSDALIGSFKCDIGMVYDEQQHSFINKWLLLSDPEDNMAGAKGYLKICATVLGPGDEAPSIKQATQDDSEDIESNLLRPAGVQLRPATFTLKLYRAEDIPRMDTAFFEGMKKVLSIGEEQKELVDPYFVFSFAGKEVRSKIMYGNDHPEWNQELRLGLRFPSMCERIKFIVRDWDRLTDDDTIGTYQLPLSLISSSGNSEEDEGFLPTFGPCFINFYGSTREYSDLPDEYDDLNLGKGEGVAFRGRALLELTTKLGDFPEEETADIDSDDILRVQKFMRRRKYRLHAAFLNATMVSSIDAPVEFEISIGNYGNKLDENVPPCSSTTQPTNAVFDGCYYYFLPWGETKPCVVVDCHWEDISFRLEALNILLKIVDNLEANIERVRIGMKANLPAPEIAQLLISLLDQLVAECSKPLPKVKSGTHTSNDLDLKLAEYRKNEMSGLVSQAKKLRDTARDIHEALSEVETYLQTLMNMAQEPQNSMPDVVIWMISGEKRLAYFRIPAYEVLYASNAANRGRHCGRIQTVQLKFPGSKAKEKDDTVPALVRLKLWLGLQDQEAEWHKMQSEGELAVFAETYENQVNILGAWTNKGPTMTRPKWSDSLGKVSIPQEAFDPPPGWRWDSDWYISPELSMLFDRDAGHRTFLDDVYECQSRIPAGNWGPASRPWADVKGDPLPSRMDFQLPEGWKWDDDWQPDLNRAVDEEGWEYCVEATVGGYGPVEKTYHLCRRRRWMRPRTMVLDKKKQALQAKQTQAQAEGWEYAPLFNMKFHANERKMDLVRRRRWHRKMVAETPGAPCYFRLGEGEPKEGEESKTSMAAPRMFLTFSKSYKYQLRAYIYQARNLLAGDNTGLSDPFARVSFLTQSMVTEKVEKTLCPTWDQTLIFEEIQIYGDPRTLEASPPDIFLEIFDHDTFGAAEFLGRTKAPPMVKLDPGDARTPVLQWFPIIRDNNEAGEMLAAFELLKIPERATKTKTVHQMMDGKELPFQPPKRGKLFIVPNGIRPVMQRTGIEILCWGVRNMRKFQLSAVTSPSIEFECGGHMLNSKVIKNTKKNPNFEDPLLFFDVMLPKEELYMPPMNVKVRDHRQFGRKPTVGIHILKTMEPFRCSPVASIEELDESQGVVMTSGPNGDAIIDMPTEDKPAKKDLLEVELDWWSKYYASTGEVKKCKKYVEKGYDKLKIYDKELEKVAPYEEFSDFCHSFELNRGKDIEDEESNVVGEFKGSFRVYPLPQDPNDPLPRKILDNLPPSAPEECVVRLYVIKATDLQPNDPSGLADPYIVVTLGGKKENSRDEYVPNSVNPVFGKFFEMTTTLPVNKDLNIKIKDYDLISTDDVIGETTIDLENRYLSKYRACCGLPQSYCTSGVNQWRDSRKPKELLEDYCLKNHLSGPMFYGNNGVKVGNKVYNLADYEEDADDSQDIEITMATHRSSRLTNHRQSLVNMWPLDGLFNSQQVKSDSPHLGPAEERLALHVLRTFPLVKEHVETRPLFTEIQPGIEQGKLQMWVDIFPKSLGPPGPPFNIEPRKSKGYELRCVIWNTVDVILEEESITGEKMSDIYVKGWLAGLDEKQETDIHYRSLDGEGNFNWRFVFPFQYLPAEECMVIKKKEHFWSLDETEQRVSPVFMVQIWDNDKFSADDFLGTLELNLNGMAAPAKKARNCKLSQLPDISTGSKVKTVSLFEQKRIRGFWPCYNDETGERVLTGKVEMEIEIVAEEDVESKPAGLGRDEPNMNPVLDPPKRPETSFMWFTSPFKTLKYIIWRNYKWYIISGLIILIIALLIVIFVYSLPNELAGKLVNW
ncbi:myoferlin-like isoform X2 [Liolophura sinensis]|uniref:myoferlin-like isoform X2 n=1 Tax=Liolophura sinensis TaxID=3198878 RepID=UPI0031586EB8